MWAPREYLTSSVLVSESPGNTCTIILLLTASGKPRAGPELILLTLAGDSLAGEQQKEKMTQHSCNWLLCCLIPALNLPKS